MSGYQIPTPAGQRLPEGENLFKFFLFALLLLASFVFVDVSVHELGRDWPWIIKGTLILLFAGLNCFLIIGLGALAHDAVHRVLFRNPLLNEGFGGFASALMLAPFHANRQFHLTHHGYAHQPGLDPENEMHHRPFWQAATVGSVIGLYLQYRILAVNLTTRLTEPRFAARAIQDLGFLVLAAGFYVGLPMALGVDLRVTVLPTLLVFPLIFAFRALSDHYGVPAVARKSQQRHEIADGSDWYDPRDTIKVTGWVVLTHPLLEWLWSSVNYHEVHHKYPYLAHAHLREVFHHTRTQVPYRVAPGYLRSLFNLVHKPYYEEPARLMAAGPVLAGRSQFSPTEPHA